MPLRAGQLADRRDVLDDADLVVHVHHRHDDRVRPQRRFELREVEQPVVVHVEIGDLEAVALQLAHRVERRLVLGLHRDEVLALVLVEVRRALEREVDRLGRTRRPHELLRIAVHERGDVLARLLDRGFGVPAVLVRARRRVAEVLGEPRDHLLGHARVDRRRRRVVEVDRPLGALSGVHVSGLVESGIACLKRSLLRLRAASRRLGCPAGPLRSLPCVAARPAARA